MKPELRKWAEEYASCLEAHLAGEGEATLHSAYDLGRKAIEMGIGILDVTAVHHEALAEPVTGHLSHGECGRRAMAASSFISECLSPFEMAQRGYQETNAALRDLNLSLERRVQEKTEELEKTFKKLEEAREQFFHVQKMESIGTLVSGIAHEFNNILTTVKGHTHLAIRKIDEENPAWRHLKEIGPAADSAASLTTQLLAFGHQRKSEFLGLDLNLVVTDFFGMVTRVIGEHYSVALNLEREIWPIRGNPVLLRQAVMNVVVNARDAMPEGGEITFRTENKQFDDDLRDANGLAHSGDHVCLSISDNGVSIDDDIRDRVFDPFFGTKGPGKGTGLGLSVVYGIVSQHNGWIHLESETGQGTTVSLCLPAHGQASDAAARESVRPFIVQNSEKSAPLNRG